MQARVPPKLDKMRPKSVEHAQVALAEVALGSVESEAARYSIPQVPPVDAFRDGGGAYSRLDVKPRTVGPDARFGADLVPLFSGGYLCRRCFRRRRLDGPACPSPRHRHLPVQVPPG